jgi:hypothetical protein
MKKAFFVFMICLVAVLTLNAQPENEEMNCMIINQKYPFEYLYINKINRQVSNVNNVFTYQLSKVNKLSELLWILIPAEHAEDDDFYLYYDYANEDGI